MEIIYREILQSEAPLFADKFGSYVTEFGCLHFGDDCISLGAFDGDEPVGYISVYPEQLIAPLDAFHDAYIDDIEVASAYRRRGIATELIYRAEEFARGYGYRQLRAWSSTDKREALLMWYSLGYCLCPAIMYGEDLCPDKNHSPVVGYYVAKCLELHPNIDISSLKMTIEQTNRYRKRMIYRSSTHSFVESEHDSLAFVRSFPYPYGWIVGSGTPPEPHFDVYLVSDAPYELGDVVEIKLIGVFLRNDGDNKFIAVERNDPKNDFGELPEKIKAAFTRLYPRAAEGEGYRGRIAAMNAFLEGEKSR